MFTGIIEEVAEVVAISTEGTNKIFTITAPFTEEIQVDQSISHNGTCLTVTSLSEVTDHHVTYAVTAVQETLQKTQLNDWEVGSLINVERSMQVGDRIDGHFVQGHVDTVGKVLEVREVGGSWIFTFSFPKEHANLLVNKGSICING
ncbi:MAG: riboflavin synthase, partial [Bacteroidota bacterium]